MKKILAAVCCILICVFALVSCGGSTQPMPTRPPRTEPPVPASPIDSFTGEGWELRVLTAHTTDVSLFKPIPTDDPETVYALVYVELKNVSDTVKKINSHENFALYVNGEKAAQVYDADVYTQPDYPTINPSDVKRGEIAYAVPAGTASAELAFLTDDGTEIFRTTLPLN